VTIKRLIPIFFLLSCSADLQVFTDFDKNVSIQRLTNYDWLSVQQIESRNNPILFNELTDKRIKAAVDKQLKDKGYVKSEENAQMILHYHITVENKASVRIEPFGYNYGRYWLKNELDSYRYDEGTLIIDIMDARNCDLVWRGWAVSVLHESIIDEKLINQAVEKIFMQFPISAAKEITLP
jgi:hypothetical protein